MGLVYQQDAYALLVVDTFPELSLQCSEERYMIDMFQNLVHVSLDENLADAEEGENFYCYQTKLA